MTLQGPRIRSNPGERVVSLYGVRGSRGRPVLVERDEQRLSRRVVSCRSPSRYNLLRRLPVILGTGTEFNAGPIIKVWGKTTPTHIAQVSGDDSAACSPSRDPSEPEPHGIFHFRPGTLGVVFRLIFSVGRGRHS